MVAYVNTFEAGDGLTLIRLEPDEMLKYSKLSNLQKHKFSPRAS